MATNDRRRYVTTFDAGFHRAIEVARPFTISYARNKARTAPDNNVHAYWNGYVAGLKHLAKNTRPAAVEGATICEVPIP
jgi:hypothetical protein